MLAIAHWMADTQARVEAALSAFLPASGSIPARLHDAMRYATLGGGKRIRPLLVCAAGELTGAAPERLDRIAFSRGRFALEAANGRALTLPVQSEIGRAIEDCRE